jgi:predicted unusual protein kinase regulating ubiquinone biosynthesis (AarF/ABC1/UbiB family)
LFGINYLNSKLMYRTRYRRITWYFFQVIVGLAVWELFFPRLGLKNLVKRTRPKRLRKIAAHFRMMAIQMGGVLIKVGQFLSSRVDVMPPEITHELEGLQDEVPAESYRDMQEVIEVELGGPIEGKYHYFSETPLAAASLGQVHAAKMRVSSQDLGDQSTNLSLVDVVVKIQRPNIEKIIATDLEALRRVGQWVRYYKPIRKRANIPAMLDEFSRTLYEEIDYLAEGRNAETFASNFRDEPGVLVPKVIWTHTTRRVLTLEDVGGIKITDYQKISEAGIDRKAVANRLIHTYLKQIFEDGFFHADPHPGNLFIRTGRICNTEPSEQCVWQLTFVDFGMVGRITNKARTGMRDLLVGVGAQDTDRVIVAYQKLGFLLPGADLALLKKAETEMFDRFWGKSMEELKQIRMDEMTEFAYEFRDLLYNMPFQIPQDIIFLGRAVGILSGICTGLVEDFNVWEALVPYSKTLLKEESLGSPKMLLEEAGKIGRKLLGLPGRVDSILGKLEHGELVTRDPQLARQIERLERSVLCATGGIIFAAFLLGAVQSYLADQIWLAVSLGIGSGLTIGWVALKRH